MCLQLRTKDSDTHYEVSITRLQEILVTPRKVGSSVKGHTDSKQRPGRWSLRSVQGMVQGSVFHTLKHSLKIQAEMAKEGRQ